MNVVFHTKGFYTVLCLYATNWKYKKSITLMKYWWVTSTDSYWLFYSNLQQFLNFWHLYALNDKWFLDHYVHFPMGSVCDDWVLCDELFNWLNPKFISTLIKGAIVLFSCQCSTTVHWSQFVQTVSGVSTIKYNITTDWKC